MSLVSCVGVFFVIWWLCLFVVLPFGIEAQHESDDVVPGTDRGAPINPLILKKAIATTALSAVVFSIVYVYFGVYHMSIADLIR
jgi:predicted secreted protein